MIQDNSKKKGKQEEDVNKIGKDNEDERTRRNAIRRKQDTKVRAEKRQQKTIQDGDEQRAEVGDEDSAGSKERYM